MTAKELAAALTGCEVGMEIMPGEERDAKALADIFRRAPGEESRGPK